jgi:phosphatidylserine decarboxylase
VSAGPGLATRLFVALQYLLPQHALSRLVHRATRVQAAWFRKPLVRAFVRVFRPDMAEAAEPDPCAYPTFNAFFTRSLRAGSRQLAAAPRAITSPVDGVISEAGTIRAARLIQAKGHEYSLDALLAGRDDWAGALRDGVFMTIYLAPWDYHRIHMPCAGVLRETLYVPGRLFSVNQATADHVPGLFARNERVACRFDAEAGPCVLVMVGALNVGSIETIWHGEVTPGRERVRASVPPLSPAPPLAQQRGAEIARFNMGSTVILLFPSGVAQWLPGLGAGAKLRLGEQVGVLTARAATAAPARALPP